jgi:hypothetical protein
MIIKGLQPSLGDLSVLCGLIIFKKQRAAPRKETARYACNHSKSKADIKLNLNSIKPIFRIYPHFPFPA